MLLYLKLEGGRKADEVLIEAGGLAAGARSGVQLIVKPSKTPNLLLYLFAAFVNVQLPLMIPAPLQPFNGYIRKEPRSSTKKRATEA